MNAGSPTPPVGLEDLVAAEVGRLGPSISAHQRALHQIPELGYAEHETAAYLAGVVRGWGLTPRTGVAGTGLVVELPNAGAGPTVLLRADMDGLPVEEAADHDPRSRFPGRMHACGHDGHMAIALGAVESVIRLGPGVRLPGRIVVLFQPAEEGGAGAQKVVEAGILDEFGIDFVLGIHLWSFLPRGTALIPNGPVMASSDEFRVVLSGTGGHGALPHQAADVVLAASQLVVAFQQIVSRSLDPLQPAVVTVGRIAAGEAHNVLPGTAELWGTFRSADQGTRDLIGRRLGQITTAVAAEQGIEARLVIGPGYPPTINHPQVAAVARQAAADVLGAGQVLDGPMTMAAEDFAFLLEKRPGAFSLLGIRDEGRGLVHPHHNQRFRIPEDLLPQGAEILLRTAFRLMSGSNRV